MRRNGFVRDSARNKRRYRRMIKLNKQKQKVLTEDTVCINCPKELLKIKLDEALECQIQNRENTDKGLSGEYITADKLYKIKYRYRRYEPDTANTMDDYYILAELNKNGKNTDLHYMFISDSGNSIYRKIIGVICCLFSAWMMFYAYSSGNFGWMLFVIMFAIFLCGILLCMAKGDDRLDADNLPELFKQVIDDINNSL